jgi:hypothetical protein
MLYDNDTIEEAGATFRVTFPYDDSSDAPWEREDGHGPVSDWRNGRYTYTGRPSKAPGERPLCSDGGSARFYDFAEACRIARRDGWGWLPGELETKQIDATTWQAKTLGFVALGGNINEAIRNLYASHRASMSAKAYAAEAARRDYQRLADWCNDRWQYVGVVVELLDDDGDPMGERASLWGIESDATGYLEEVAHELAAEVLAMLEVAA